MNSLISVGGKIPLPGRARSVACRSWNELRVNKPTWNGDGGQGDCPPRLVNMPYMYAGDLPCLLALGHRCRRGFDRDSEEGKLMVCGGILFRMARLSVGEW